MAKGLNQSKVKWEELLERGVTDVVPRGLAIAKLESGKKLRIYLGIDPTGAKLHLGHAVPLRKLRAFQAAGHHVILVIGSFTAMIGDPSGREAIREPLTEQEVKANFATYQKQAQLVLDLDKVEIRYNHDWLGKLKFKEVVELAQHFTLQQLMERDMFVERQRLGQAIGVHELMYPLMVGRDSVELDVDCEIGGNDQLFNMLCGRDLQKDFGKRDKFVVTTKLLEGTDGRKMSKTYDNCIYLTDKANDMYGKVMSIKDELVMRYFECCTDATKEEMAMWEQALRGGKDTKVLKQRLAREIVTLYHSAKAATAAEHEFNQVHRDKALPSDMPTVPIPAGKKSLPITEFLVYMKLAMSKSEARRLVEQGGVKIDGKVISDWRAEISLKPGLITQVGSRKFAKLG
ncbi:MAG: tyrosine--tRNA ligase [Candidatus Kerfeldbacteria bacterium]|nr:tyrosine--tRNA ligase [Candidatus Kerfeldbacteria bacterium]